MGLLSRDTCCCCASRFVNHPVLGQNFGLLLSWETGLDNDDMQSIDLTSSVYIYDLFFTKAIKRWRVGMNHPVSCMVHPFLAHRRSMLVRDQVSVK